MQAKGAETMENKIMYKVEFNITIMHYPVFGDIPKWEEKYFTVEAVMLCCQTQKHK